MNPTEQLARSLLSESKAYGYTLTIWGGGAILMNQYGSPRIVEIFLYILGALAAFGILAGITFDELFSTPTSDPDEQLIVASMVHVVATFGNLILGYGILAALNPGFPANWGFLLIGFWGTLSYNLLLLLESGFARFVTSTFDTVEVGS
ncbi:hypothetical protein [Haladaptatus sp. CMAA 1911]|uniref:hypothetical protein n=1 Tax=unclassified Haladaptatus TaxID=2622732 RepID=UPI0037545278